MKKVIETKRLILRPFHHEDNEDVFILASNDKVARAAGWRVVTSYMETQYILENVLIKANEWAIELKETHKVIGSISICDDLFNCEERMLSYLLNEDYWQQGYMYEALSTLLIEQSVDAINAYHFVDNFASSALLKKLGFQEVAYLEESYPHYNGKYYDLIKHTKSS